VNNFVAGLKINPICNRSGLKACVFVSLSLMCKISFTADSGGLTVSVLLWMC